MILKNIENFTKRQKNTIQNCLNKGDFKRFVDYMKWHGFALTNNDLVSLWKWFNEYHYFLSGLARSLCQNRRLQGKTGIVIDINDFVLDHKQVKKHFWKWFYWLYQRCFYGCFCKDKIKNILTKDKEGNIIYVIKNKKLLEV